MDAAVASEQAAWAAVEEIKLENSRQSKRQRARQAILSVKIKLSEDINAEFNKFKIANHYAMYHPEVQHLVQDYGWWPIDVIPVRKNTLAEHQNAPEQHVSFKLKLFKDGNIKIVHACSKGITDQ